jgi:hypothetical protein
MKLMNPSIRLLAVCALAIAAMPGCEREEGPAEKAGKAIDEAVETSGNAVEEAGEKIDKAFEEAEKKRKEAEDKD